MIVGAGEVPIAQADGHIVCAKLFKAAIGEQVLANGAVNRSSFQRCNCIVQSLCRCIDVSLSRCGQSCLGSSQSGLHGSPALCAVVSFSQSLCCSNSCLQRCGINGDSAVFVNAHIVHIDIHGVPRCRNLKADLTGCSALIEIGISGPAIRIGGYGTGIGTVDAGTHAARSSGGTLCLVGEDIGLAGFDINGITDLHQIAALGLQVQSIAAVCNICRIGFQECLHAPCVIVGAGEVPIAQADGHAVCTNLLKAAVGEQVLRALINAHVVHIDIHSVPGCGNLKADLTGRTAFIEIGVGGPAIRIGGNGTGISSINAGAHGSTAGTLHLVGENIGLASFNCHGITDFHQVTAR